MSIRLTKMVDGKAYCNVNYCPEDCNTCSMFNEIRTKLSNIEIGTEAREAYKDDEICLNCHWFEVSYYDSIDDGYYDGVGVCHRYPSTVDVSCDDWCGEFRRKE